MLRLAFFPEAIFLFLGRTLFQSSVTNKHATSVHKFTLALSNKFNSMMKELHSFHFSQFQFTVCAVFKSTYKFINNYNRVYEWEYLWLSFEIQTVSFSVRIFIASVYLFEILFQFRAFFSPKVQPCITDTYFVWKHMQKTTSIVAYFALHFLLDFPSVSFH